MLNSVFTSCHGNYEQSKIDITIISNTFIEYRITIIEFYTIVSNETA